MNLVKLRSRTGRSVICFDRSRVATSARSVLSSGDPPVTSTARSAVRRSSAKSTGVCASTLTCTALDTIAGLKPCELRLDLVDAGQQALFDDTRPDSFGDDGVGGVAIVAGDRDGDARQDGSRANRVTMPPMLP